MNRLPCRFKSLRAGWILGFEGNEMTTVNPAQSAFAANAAPAPASTVLNSDFETFLKMLTVQMQNQDPLNPMDSSEYAMQLATFSGLEQQVLTNELLNSLIYLGSQTGVSGLADWIGLEGGQVGKPILMVILRLVCMRPH